MTQKKRGKESEGRWSVKMPSILSHCLRQHHRDTCQARGTLNLLKILTPQLWGAAVKNSPANARDPRDVGSIPGSGRAPGEENGNPLQYSCLGNPTDREAWWAAAHGVTKSDATEHTNTILQRAFPKEPRGFSW